jgi:phosphoenolpyruvate carboxylase
MITVADLDQRLQELHVRTAETPLFNPVFQLGLELSRQLESGALSLGDVESLVAELECEGLRARAARLRRLVSPLDPEANEESLRALADDEDFTAFAARWQRPLAHIVFTAHPTFLLTKAQTAAVAASASSGDISVQNTCTAPHERDAITLDSEHEAVMAAMARAQDARDRIAGLLLSRRRAGPSAGARSSRCPCGWRAGSAMTWMGAPTSAGPPRCAIA